jgi:hypothetical protein
MFLLSPSGKGKVGPALCDDVVEVGRDSGFEGIGPGALDVEGDVVEDDDARGGLGEGMEDAGLVVFRYGEKVWDCDLGTPTEVESFRS